MSCILVGLDVETTGCHLFNHSMIELGAVAVDSKSKVVLSAFSSQMKMRPGTTWEERCLVEFWDDVSWKKLPEGPERSQKEEEYLSKQERMKRVAEGEEPKDAMQRFVKWLREDVLARLAGSDHTKIFFVVDTVSFDTNWINVYLNQFTDALPLHCFFDGYFNDVTCSSSYAKGLAGVKYEKMKEVRDMDGWFSSRKHCRAILCIPDGKKPIVEHDHKAVNDATHLVQEHLIHIEHALVKY